MPVNTTGSFTLKLAELVTVTLSFDAVMLVAVVVVNPTKSNPIPLTGTVIKGLE